MKYYVRKKDDALFLVEKLNPLNEVVSTDLSHYELKKGTFEDEIQFVAGYTRDDTRFGYVTLTDGILIVVASESVLKEMMLDIEEDFLSARTKARVRFGSGVAANL